MRGRPQNRLAAFNQVLLSWDKFFFFISWITLYDLCKFQLFLLQKLKLTCVKFKTNAKNNDDLRGFGQFNRDIVVGF